MSLGTIPVARVCRACQGIGEAAGQRQDNPGDGEVIDKSHSEVVMPRIWAESR